MALNKDGYSTEIEVTLPKAQRQKTAEAEAGGRAALYQKIQEKNAARSESVPATCRCDRCGRSHHSNPTSTQEVLPLPKLPGGSFRTEAGPLRRINRVSSEARGEKLGDV